MISSHRETIKSHLAIILDDSESMKFSDPYTDQSRAAEIASKMKLESAGGRSSVERLRETPRLGLVKHALGANLDALAKGREIFLYDLESAARPGSGESARKRTLEDIQPNRPISPVGDAIHGVLAGHRGQPVAGLVIATDGRSNAGEEPLKAIEAAVRQNIPIFAIAAGGGRRAAERAAGGGRGEPGRVRPRPDDAGRRGGGPGAARRRGDDRAGTANQRK